jgi:two-component system sensor histidine kinase PilS (NtrC family)
VSATAAPTVRPAAAPGEIARGAPSGATPAASDDGLHRKLVWLTLFRIATITVLLGGTAAVNWQFGPRATGLVAPLYIVVAVTYAASLAFAVLLGLRAWEGPVAVGQVALDVGIATAVVATTGLSDSVFVFMYLLAIVNGSVVLHRAGAVGALALALAAYGALVLALHPDPEAVRGALFAHGSAFVATAALAGYLAEQLRSTGERLAASESDLAAVTALHGSIVQSVTSGLLTLDRQGRVTFLNRAGEQITGLALAEVTGQAGARWFPAFAGTSREEVPFVNARGEWRLLGYTAFPLLGRDDAHSGTAVIFQDLTELRAMEEAVQRSKRLADLGEVAAGLAHELRNPLASISGCVELLRGAQGLSDEDGRVLGIVLRETGRLDALLTRFLEFSRPTPPARRPGDLAAVAAETLDMFAADPVAAGVALERALAPAPASFDPDQLRQVVLNLLSNAAQALRESGKGGRVRLACAPSPGGGAVLSVEDDGPGIAPAVAGRIFTPFFTTKAKGTGLGLAVVQRIVDAHGGSVSVQSTPGAGARFVVRLPSPSAPPLEPR